MCKQRAWSFGITQKIQKSILEGGSHIVTTSKRAASMPDYGRLFHGKPVSFLCSSQDAIQLRKVFNCI